MELYKKLLKRIENGEPIYCNETFAKDLQAIADKHYAKQLHIQGVVVEKRTLCESCKSTGYDKRKQCMDCKGSGNI